MINLKKCNSFILDFENGVIMEEKIAKFVPKKQ